MVRTLMVPRSTAGLIATASLAMLSFGLASALAQTTPSLGAASAFAVLGGTNVTCTGTGILAGDLGVSPGGAVPFTNTACTLTGGAPPATNAAATPARAALLQAYTQLENSTCTATLDSAYTGTALTLPPGVYCSPAAVTFTNTTVTLDGSTNPNGVWIFKVGAALTGTGLQVVMANGAQPCKAFWLPGAAVTLTASQFQGNILAGDPIGGSITITGGSVVGRVLANVAVTMTSTEIHGTCAVVTQPCA